MIITSKESFKTKFIKIELVSKAVLTQSFKIVRLFYGFDFWNGVFLTRVFFRNEYFLHEGINDGV